MIWWLRENPIREKLTKVITTNPKENRCTKNRMEVYNKINLKYVTTTCGLVDVTSQNSKSLDSSIHELCSMWTPVHNKKNPLEDSSQQLVYELI